jgi:hypothetical protein
MNIELNTMGGRCYNEKFVKKALKRARKDAKKRRAEHAESTPQVADTNDGDAIIAFAEARGCRELGLAWVRAGLGSLAEFKSALAANYDRIQRLFPGGIVR